MIIDFKKNTTAIVFVKWTLFCITFYLIPILFAYSWSDQMRQREEDKQIEEKMESMNRVLTYIQAKSDTQVFLEQVLQLLSRRVFQSSSPPETFQMLTKHLNNRFPGMFEFIYLDESGTPVRELCTNPVSTYILKRFFNDLKNFIAGDDGAFTNNWRFYRNLLGPMTRMRNLPIERLDDANHESDKAFVFISMPHPEGAFLAFVNRSEDWDIVAIRDLAHTINNRSNRMRFMFYRSESNVSSQASDWGMCEDELSQVTEKFLEQPSSELRTPGAVWSRLQVGHDISLLGRISRDRDSKAYQSRGKLQTLGAIVFVIFALPTWWVMSGKWSLFISIRVKLILLFLYTSGLPLIVIGMTAQDYVQEKRYVLENELHQENMQMLQNFDNSFLRIIGDMQSLLLSTFELPISGDDQEKRNAAIALIREVRGKMDLSGGYLVDDNGDPFFLEGIDPAIRRNLRMIRPLYRNIIQNLNNERPDINELATSKVAQLGAAAGLEVEAIYSDLVRSISRLNIYSYGNRSSVQGIFPIKDDSGRYIFLAIFSWRIDRLTHRYIDVYLPRLAREMRDTELLAHNSNRGERKTTGEFSASKWLDFYLDRIATTRQSLSSTISEGDTRYLITGIPGESIPNYDLVAITADHRIKEEINEILQRIRWFSASILLICITVGATLSIKFLEPVKSLEKGVTALRRREFSQRLEIHDIDELGKLTDAFNQMMEGMADLEVAKIIQDCLFPQKELREGSISIYGKCVPAGEAGGDYFDYFLLPSGKILLLIGDVSGHGVGAALVMSMAKGLIIHLSKISEDSTAMLDAVNMTIFEVLERKKMMTCFLGIIDPASKTMTFSNAGHHDPLLIRNGVLQQVSIDRKMPLGISKKTRYCSSSFTLAKGDVMILYTDGIFEAQKKDGNMIGYKGFQEALPFLTESTPQITEHSIRKWLEQTVKEGPQEDDITIIAIQID